MGVILGAKHKFYCLKTKDQCLFLAKSFLKISQMAGKFLNFRSKFLKYFNWTKIGVIAFLAKDGPVYGFFAKRAIFKAFFTNISKKEHF